jgi:hypothetical protein
MDVVAVDIFLSERPHYTREHVMEIAEAMRRGGIPFCQACADWHSPDDDHTEG